ncbi:MAG: pantoate--beta-alanine ligase [Pseudomonadota bacterium]|nr:pantoate--beta-alanine ligase [Pseudomonadota bacterium]
MRVIEDLKPLRDMVYGWHCGGSRVALVPTMGNLHPGHLSLVERAKREADRVVVSIFVNPTQFGENEDFGAYPRTPSEDERQLREAGADVLFRPSAQLMYPEGLPPACWIVVPEISDVLCGASRPGHFRGVATVVAKLLNMVSPDVAVFGEKDFQQLVIIQRVVRELRIPTDVVGVGIQREANGLAMSSRNQYLTPLERQTAGEIYTVLNWIKERVEAGDHDFGALEQAAADRLAEKNFRVDYVAIRCAKNLRTLQAGDSEGVALVAARLGKARLIDNVRVTLK